MVFGNDRNRLYGGQYCGKTIKTLFFSLLLVCGSSFGQRSERTPLSHRQGRTGNFYTVRIPYHEEFKRFYAEAYALITNIPEDGDPYGAEKTLMQQGDYDVVHLSAVPKMYFTSTTYTVAEAGNGCSHPLMTAGKVVPRGERLVFPLSIYVNHAFVDGSHLASFFEKIEKYLKEISHE